MKTVQLSCALIALLLISFSSSALAQSGPEPVDQAAVDLIRKQGLEDSHVMEYMSWMTDVYGARLTGSPALDAASDWALSEFRSLGMENVHKDKWGPFGRGWTLDGLSVTARTAHGSFPLTAFPKAWSPGTNGKVSGEVVLVEVETEEDLDRYRGKLGGKIVMTQSIREVDEHFEPLAERRDDSNLLNLANAAPQVRARSGGGRFNNPDFMARRNLQRATSNMIFAEKPLAIIDRGSKGDYGTIFVSGASVPSPPDAGFRGGPRAWDASAPETVPQMTVAVEHYNRIARLLEKEIPVTIEVDLEVTFTDDDLMEYNLIGEFKGSDSEIGEEVVMLGAHFDSWHAGTGATDNASGSAVMMEAMRILKNVYAELGRAPRRTIRIGLWTGEEQGLMGSRAYVDKTLAERGGQGNPPITKPDYDKFSAYYNLDNGTGKIRGVYMQGNAGVEPIFRSWLSPFADLDASTLTIRNTGGTDHQSFDGVGLPGFQFIQEPISYSTRTHHSNMDVYDHAIADDLMQAATIIASFAYHSAERDKKLPRKEQQRVTVRPAQG